jgi:AcrR family transcriptional regulator
MTKKRRSKQERTAEILQLAKRRFKKTGLADTTLDMIAEDARLPRPHLYRFFKSKAAIVSAVIADEIAEINARRWTEVKKLRSFERQIVRSLELSVELIEGDEFWSSLITPGNVPHTAYAASADPAILRANADYWDQILERANAKGELRKDVERDRILNWLLGIQFMFMERREIFSSINEVGRYAEEFVVPALKKQ